MITFDTAETPLGFEWRMIETDESGSKKVLSRSCIYYKKKEEAVKEHQRIQNEVQVKQLKLDL